MTLWRGWAVFLFSTHVARGLLRIEDSDPRVTYNPSTPCSRNDVASCLGFWSTEKDTLAGATGNTFHSTTGGANVFLSLTFNGSTVSLNGRRSQRAGVAYMTIDGAFKGIVHFSTLEEHGESELLFQVGAMDPRAEHTLKLEYASDLGNGRVEIDYFEVEDGSSAANAARDPEPEAATAVSSVFPPYLTAISLAMGIISLVLALLLAFYCCYTRRRMRSRIPAASHRPSISIDVPLRQMQLYEQPAPRRVFTPPDAPSHRPSSPGVPVDERVAKDCYPTLSQIAGNIPETPTSAVYSGRTPLRATHFRVHNPDPASSEGGSQHRWRGKDYG